MDVDPTIVIIPEAVCSEQALNDAWIVISLLERYCLGECDQQGRYVNLWRWSALFRYVREEESTHRREHIAGGNLNRRVVPKENEGLDSTDIADSGGNRKRLRLRLRLLIKRRTLERTSSHKKRRDKRQKRCGQRE